MLKKFLVLSRVMGGAGGNKLVRLCLVLVCRAGEFGLFVVRCGADSGQA